jgi:hypothetical protein
MSDTLEPPGGGIAIMGEIGGAGGRIAESPAEAAWPAPSNAPMPAVAGNAVKMVEVSGDLTTDLTMFPREENKLIV